MTTQDIKINHSNCCYTRRNTAQKITLKQTL